MKQVIVLVAMIIVGLVLFTAVTGLGAKGTSLITSAEGENGGASGIRGAMLDADGNLEIPE